MTVLPVVELAAWAYQQEQGPDGEDLWAAQLCLEAPSVAELEMETLGLTLAEVHLEPWDLEAQVREVWEARAARVPEAWAWGAQVLL